MLSETEQMIVMDICLAKEQNRTFTYESQKITKSRSFFYQIMKKLELKGLVNLVNGLKGNNYTLTDNGLVLAVLLSKPYDTPDKYHILSKVSVYWWLG